jgi:hypothetical protein
MYTHIHTSNSQVLNALPLPLTVATIQLGVGAIYVLLTWL